MGFKRNFCCCCCCPQKAKKYVKSVAILTIVLAILGILSNIRGFNTSTETSGGKGVLASAVIFTLIYIVEIVYSIIILSHLGKKKYGAVKSYGVMLLIFSIIGLLIVVVGFVMTLLVAGVIGNAVGGSDGAAAAVGFAAIFGFIVYGLYAWLIIWTLVLAVGTMKAGDHLTDKNDESSKSSSSSENEAKNKPEHDHQYAGGEYNQQYQAGDNQAQAFPQPQ